MQLTDVQSLLLLLYIAIIYLTRRLDVMQRGNSAA
jgi:hypothetical protein